ncbi:MAG: fibronectin type III domain-containing protein [Bacteroidales bacterium]|nr:fibronectin type III domain-containing protein [Bacteroidales bacterium]
MKKLIISVFTLLGLLMPFWAGAQDVVYTCNFESAAENALWQRGSGTTVINKWVIGSAVHTGENSDSALYVSNNNGVSNAYSTTASSIFARRQVHITRAGWHTASYDWRALGYSSTCYLRVALVPANISIPADQTGTISGLTYNTLPSGWIALDGGRATTPGDATMWRHQGGAFRADTGLYNLVFYWRNSTSSYNPPAAIDNIVIATASCPNVDSVRTSNSTEHSIDLTVFSSMRDPFYYLYYQAENASGYDSIPIYGNTQTIYDLDSSTIYTAWIRAYCGEGDSSWNDYSFYFSTECATIDEMPYNWGFESSLYYTDDNTDLSYPNCWANLTGTANGYEWVPYSSAQRSGQRCYRFDGTTALSYLHDAWLITPEINFTGNESLSIWMRSASASTTANYHCRMKVMVSTPTASGQIDTANYEVVPLSTGETRIDMTGSTYQKFTFPMNGFGGRRHVAFVVDTCSYTFYIDDLRVNRPTTCGEPVNPRLLSIAHDSAIITWNDTNRTNPTSNWEVFVVPEGARIDTVPPLYAYEDTLAIGELQPNTTYAIYVRASCTDREYSPTTEPLIVSTQCTPSTVPYRENFDRYSSNSYEVSCWQLKTNNLSTTRPATSTSYRYSSPTSLYHYCSTVGGELWSVLPRMSAPLDSLMLRFKMLRYNSTSTSYTSVAYVGIISNPNDISTFDTIATIDLTTAPTNTWNNIEVPFRGYRGSGNICLLVPAGAAVGRTYNYVYLDDVEVIYLPDCYMPTNIHTSALSDTSATLIWDGQQTNNYIVAYSTVEVFNPDTVTAPRKFAVTNDTTATLSHLSATTYYYVRVAHVCGQDTFWSMPYTFYTPLICAPTHHFTPVHLVHNTTTTYTMLGTSSSYVRGATWQIFTEEELRRAGIEENTYIHDISFQVSSAPGTLGHFRVRLATTRDTVFSAVSDSLTYGQMTQVADTHNFALKLGWNTVHFNNPFYYSGEGSLVVMLERTGGTMSSYTYLSCGPTYNGGNKTIYTYTTTGAYRYAYLYSNSLNTRFNVCTQTPACPRPDGLRVNRITNTNAIVRWNHDEAASHTVAYGLIGEIIDSIPASQRITTTADSLVINGLRGDMYYVVYLRANCNSTDTSLWTSGVDFHTQCGAQGLPITENFNSYAASTSPTTSTTTINRCWNKFSSNSGTSYPYVNSTAHTTEGNSLVLYTDANNYCYVTLPQPNTDLRNLIVYADVMQPSTYPSGVLHIGVMTDPNDISTFTSIKTITDHSNTWLRQNATFENYTGSGRYVAFVLPVGYTAMSYLDNIRLDNRPSCWFPTELTVVNRTRTTITLKWRRPQTVPANGYQVEYGLEGFIRGQGQYATCTDTTITLTNLQPGTYYDVAVRSSCGNNNYSDWTNPINTSTECGVITTLPFTEGFESYTTGTTARFPLCWARGNENTASNGTLGTYPYVYGGVSHTGSHCMYFYNSTSTTYPNHVMLVLPEVDTTTMPINTLQLKFFARSSSAVTPFYVGTLTDPTDMSTLTVIDTVQINSAYQEFEISLNHGTPRGSYIALGLIKGSTYYYAYLDDITIRRIPTCSRATGLEQVSSTNNSADLRWTSNSNNSLWQVKYVRLGYADTHYVSVNTLPCTLNDLQPSTCYSFNVRPICSGADTGEWAATDGFITTGCEVYELAGETYEMRFEEFPGTYYNTASMLPPCWEGYTNGTDTNYAPHIAMGGYTNSASRGAMSLSMSVSTSTNVGTEKTLVLPMFEERLNTMTLDFYLYTINTSSSTSKLYIGFLTSENYDGGNFFALDSISPSSQSNTNAYARLGATAGQHVVKSYANVPSNAVRMALRLSGSSSLYVSLDEFSISSNETCYTPRDINVSCNSNSFIITLPESAQWTMSWKKRTSTEWTDSGTFTGYTTMVRRLSQGVTYDVRVRKNCGNGRYSNYRYAEFTTTGTPCTKPTDLHTQEVTNSVVYLQWNATVSARQWIAHTFNTVTDKYDTLAGSGSARTMRVDGLLDGRNYSVALMAVCDGNQSDWSDTISFTTLTCDTVSNVHLVQVQGNTADIAWTAGPNNINLFEVIYGEAGFMGEEGTIVRTETNSIHLENLLGDESYDVYVRGLCGERDYASTWSSMLRFTTGAAGILGADGLTHNVTIAPNPAHGNTTLSIQGAGGRVSITIVDINGHTVYRTEVECTEECTHVVALNQLATGAYFVKVTGDGVNSVNKLIVK